MSPPPTRTTSFWEKHKHNLFIFGEIYATIYGLMVINYIPSTKSTKSCKYYVALVYGHMLSFVVIVVLPLYFVWNIKYLIETNDTKSQLQLLVNFTNTFIKYCMVVITYVANFVHYKDIRSITARRQKLEDDFNRFYCGSDVPRQRFEFMCLFKFVLINASMVVQVSQIVYQHFLGTNAVRIQFQLYAFFLWNYTENMADYFYFINVSALRFARQLQEQLQEALGDNRQYMRRRRNIRGILGCTLSDRIDGLALNFTQIHELYRDSVRIHEFQILGLILTALITSLTTLFTIFNLLMRHAGATDKIPDIIMNFIFAIVFYADTYIVTMISGEIITELENINISLKEFAELPAIDWRLEESIEYFSFLSTMHKGYFSICGLFYLDRHLTYLTAATGLTYFITLVQFEMNWNK